MPASSASDQPGGDLLDAYREAEEARRAVKERLTKKVTRARHPEYGHPDLEANDLLVLLALTRLPRQDAVTYGMSLTDAPTREALSSVTGITGRHVSTSANRLWRLGFAASFEIPHGRLHAGDGRRAHSYRGLELTERGRQLLNWVFDGEPARGR